MKKIPCASCGKAVTVIRIYRGKTLKKTIKAGTVATNKKARFLWLCTLGSGRYTLKVYATDIAGNAQTKVGSARLAVH